MRDAIRALTVTLPLLAALAGCGREPPRGDIAAAVAPPLGVVARGRVDVEGGEVALGMSVDGVIAGVAAKEGDHVSQGQVLVTVDATAARIDTDLARAKLAEAQTAIRLQRTRVTAAKTRAARLAEAAKLDAGDRQSADDAREAQAQATGELDNANAGLRTARAELEHARYVASQQQLRAPVDGEVLRVAATPGMRVSAQGAPLVTLLPDRTRIVRAELDEDAIDAVAPGQRAQIVSDDGRQTPLGPAHVLRIGPVYGPATLQEDPQQRINERTVECVLAFDGSAPLRVGRRVLVRFASKATETRHDGSVRR